MPAVRVSAFPECLVLFLVPCSQVGLFGLILAKFELSSPPLTEELMSAAQKQAARMTVHGIKTLVRALALLHLYDWTLLLELGTVARSQLGEWARGVLDQWQCRLHEGLAMAVCKLFC
jgi:hypothetical protein